MTWTIKKEEIDKTITLKEAMKFSQKHRTKVIVEDFCIFENGVVTCLMT